MGEEGCIKGGDGRVKKRKILKIDTYMCTRVYIHVCSTITGEKYFGNRVI